MGHSPMAWDLMPWQGSLETVLLRARRDYESYEGKILRWRVAKTVFRKQRKGSGKKAYWEESTLWDQRAPPPIAFSGPSQRTGFSWLCWGRALPLSRAVSSQRRVMLGDAGSPSVSELIGLQKSRDHGGTTTEQNQGSNNWVDGTIVTATGGLYP